MSILDRIETSDDVKKLSREELPELCDELRKYEMQYNRDVYIDKNVWIGAGAIILPGVHIGKNSVIGAGSVVTHDIPAGVLAYGVPCRVIREITKEDEKAMEALI